MTAPDLPPGWYTDQSGASRYWDGSNWLTALPASDALVPTTGGDGPSRRGLWIVLASLAVVAILSTGTYFVVMDQVDRAAVAEAQAAATQLAEEEAAAEAKAAAIEAERAESEERQQDQADTREREEREATVKQLEAEVLKTAEERHDEGFYTEEILRAECMPVTGSSIDELSETSTTFTCMGVTEDNDDGTYTGYSMEAVINWTSGQMTWG